MCTWQPQLRTCAVGGLARDNAEPEAREVLGKKVTVACALLSPTSVQVRLEERDW